MFCNLHASTMVSCFIAPLSKDFFSSFPSIYSSSSTSLSRLGASEVVESSSLLFLYFLILASPGIAFPSHLASLADLDFFGFFSEKFTRNYYYKIVRWHICQRITVYRTSIIKWQFTIAITLIIWWLVSFYAVHLKKNICFTLANSKHYRKLMRSPLHQTSSTVLFMS